MKLDPATHLIWGSKGNMNHTPALLRVYLDNEEKEAVRWAEIEERLKHGKALHEAAERSDLASL
jgi:hypothetical protein